MTNTRHLATFVRSGTLRACQTARKSLQMAVTFAMTDTFCARGLADSKTRSREMTEDKRRSVDPARCPGPGTLDLISAVAQPLARCEVVLHVQKELRTNWKAASAAFLEAYS